MVEKREEDEETVVVDREAEAETLVVDRADRTVVVQRGSGPDSPTAEGPAVDGTVAVTRERPKTPVTPSVPGGRRRRGMSMPPVAPGYGRGAVEAVGPGAVATYQPRAIPEPPAAPPEFRGVAATRVLAPSMPSVARRARRTGTIVLVVFAASCVVSIVGLVALAVAVFG